MMLCFARQSDEAPADISVDTHLKVLNAMFDQKAVAYLHMIDFEPSEALLPAAAEAIRKAGPLRPGEYLLPLRVMLPKKK